MKALRLAYIAIFFIFQISSTGAQGSVQLYLDGDCTNPGGLLVSLNAGVCLPANQSLGIEAFSLPSCSNGRPFLVISDRDECQQPSILPPVKSGNVKVCLSFATGLGIASAAFDCVGEITTVSHNTNQNPVTSMLATIISATSVVPVISTASTPQESTTEQGPQSGGTLSVSDKIALGVGIGIGVPTLLVGAWACMHNMLREDVPGRLRLIEGDGPPPPYELHDR